MRPFRGVFVWGCALALVALAAGPGRAAWHNVFQVCCNSCGTQSASNFVAPDPCCAPPPQQVCTTRYVQRTYYQPVTCYQTKTYYEPVTTYKTSYYYEPCTSYRYSCYYDPCTCSYQQVACPVTSYRLKSQCCPVTSYLQRCCMVPVTTYQQSCYWEPVTSCCTQPACPPGAPPVAGPVSPGVPGVNDGGATPMPGVGDPNAGISNKQLGFSRGPLPNRQLAPQNPAAKPATPLPAAPPNVQLDKIVFAPLPGVEGQLVGFDGKAPQSGDRFLFDHADRQGQFRAELASGNWLVYLHAADGKPVFHSKIEVRDDNPNRLTLFSK